MKFIFTIVIIAFLADLSYAIDKEEAKKMFLATVDNCKGPTGVSDGDIEKFKNCELVENREAKCFAACVFKGLGMITPDNKANKEIVMAGIGLMYENPDHIKKGEEIVDECMPTTDADECEAAYKIAQCWNAGKEARGIPKKSS